MPRAGRTPPGYRRFVVDGCAVVQLETRAGEPDTPPLDDEDAEVIAAVDAFKRGGPYLTSEAPRALVVAKVDAARVAAGLVSLCNLEDEDAERKRKRGRDYDPEGARYARAASRGLSTLAGRVMRYAAE